MAKKKLKAKIKLYCPSCGRSATAVKGKLVTCCGAPMKERK
jgi:ribosomal protein L37E